MRNGRKIATMLLALVFVMSIVLAGCNKKQSSSEVSPTAAQKTEAPAVTVAPTAAPKEKPGLEPVELSIYFPGTEQKDKAAVEAELNKLLKDKINATVKINAIDWGNWASKINLMVASGEPFDLMFTAGWDNFSGNVAKGAFLDLTPLIDKHAQEMKSQMNPLLLSGTMVNGKNYAIPVEKELASEFGVVLNKDLVDKYKFDLTTLKTFADLEPMLKIIKEKEPKVTPIWGGKNNLSLMPFEHIGNNAVPGAISKDGSTKVINEFETPEMQETLKLMKSWNQKGYFQKDPATQKVADSFNKAGTIFAQWQQLTPGKDASLSQQWGHPIVQVVLTPPYTSSGDLNGAMTAISRTTKNPERAMMLINLLHTDAKMINTLVFGVEGKHYTTPSGNVIKLPDGTTAGGYSQGINWAFGNQFLNYLWDNEDPKKWDKYKEFNAAAKPSAILGFSYDAEPVKNEEAAIVNIYDAYIDGLSTGVMDYAKELPVFIDKMKKAGLDKIIAEKQKQIEAFMKNKK